MDYSSSPFWDSSLSQTPGMPLPKQVIPIGFLFTVEFSFVFTCKWNPTGRPKVSWCGVHFLLTSRFFLKFHYKKKLLNKPLDCVEIVVSAVDTVPFQFSSVSQLWIMLPSAQVDLGFVLHSHFEYIQSCLGGKHKCDSSSGVPFFALST